MLSVILPLSPNSLSPGPLRSLHHLSLLFSQTSPHPLRHPLFRNHAPQPPLTCLRNSPGSPVSVGQPTVVWVTPSRSVYSASLTVETHKRRSQPSEVHPPPPSIHRRSGVLTAAPLDP
ncbi:hypothetical protein C8Q76DRAFT_754473 [Earliella scabrosa]|nr:hypothetical protein C8Q76DRAFT_754473 [Earliella scabrosa]